MFLVPFVSALIGGGIVVAVVAAAGDLGKSEETVTTVQATPIAPSNASQQTKGLTPHDIYVKDAPGVAFVTSTIVQKTESPFNLFGGGETQRQGQATGSGIVIDNNGTILTNYHVVENAIKVTVSFEKGKTVNAQGRRQGPVQRSRGVADSPRRSDVAPAHGSAIRAASRSETPCSRSATRSTSNAR